jgi:HPt (histidine-containing phosphotransfer) domain-containing protein
LGVTTLQQGGDSQIPRSTRLRPDAPKWLDGEILAELNQWSGRRTDEFWDKTLLDFEESYETHLEEITTGLFTSDMRTVHHAAHALKGACLMLGLVRIAAVCRAIETLDGSNNDEWPTLVAELEQGMSESLVELRTYLASLSRR